MQIIVEGMDNTGKSTLSDIIIKLFPQFQSVRRSGPFKTREDFEKCWNMDMIEPESQVRDRIGCISEMIYGKTIRGGSIVGVDSWAYLLKYLHTGPLIIYCRPSENDIHTWGDREQMAGVKDNSQALLTNYDALFHILDNVVYYPWIIRYNYKETDIMMIKGCIENWIQRSETVYELDSLMRKLYPNDLTLNENNIEEKLNECK